MKSFLSVLVAFLLVALVAVGASACDVGCGVGGGGQFFVQQAPVAASYGFSAQVFVPRQQIVYQAPRAVLVPQGQVIVRQQKAFIAQPQVNVQVQNRGLFGGRLFGRQRVNVQVR